LQKVHQMLESGTIMGKITMSIDESSFDWKDIVRKSRDVGRWREAYLNKAICAFVLSSMSLFKDVAL
jgi:hypothetical protein